MLTLSREERAEAIATISGYLAQGKTDREVMDDMGLPVDDYERLKAEFFDTRADELRTRPVEHVYVQYLVDQALNIRDLTELIEVHKSGRNANAVVGAIKARSDIQDKLIARGQEFGIIHKEATKTLVAGVIVGNLTNKQLRTTITTELEKLDQLTKRYGDDKTITELAPPTSNLHYGPKATTIVEAKLDKTPGESASSSKSGKGISTDPERGDRQRTILERSKRDREKIKRAIRINLPKQKAKRK